MSRKLHPTNTLPMSHPTIPTPEMITRAADRGNLAVKNDPSIRWNIQERIVARRETFARAAIKSFISDLSADGYVMFVQAGTGCAIADKGDLVEAINQRNEAVEHGNFLRKKIEQLRADNESLQATNSGLVESIFRKNEEIRLNNAEIVSAVKTRDKCIKERDEAQAKLFENPDWASLHATIAGQKDAIKDLQQRNYDLAISFETAKKANGDLAAALSAVQGKSRDISIGSGTLRLLKPASFRIDTNGDIVVTFGN